MRDFNIFYITLRNKTIIGSEVVILKNNIQVKLFTMMCERI